MSQSNQKAGFWVRFAAAFIDGLILMAVGFLLGGLLKNNQFLSTLIGASYSIYFWVKQDGMTLGKKVMKIKVVRVDGKPIDWMTAGLRYVGYFASAIPLFAGFIWVAFDKDSQGFHDKIAGTYVVKTE